MQRSDSEDDHEMTYEAGKLFNQTQPIARHSDDEDEASNSEYNESEVLGGSQRIPVQKNDDISMSDKTVSVNDEEEEASYGKVSPTPREEEVQRRPKRTRAIESEDEEEDQDV